MNTKMQEIAKHFNSQPARFTTQKQWQLSLGNYKPQSQETVLLYGVAADAGKFDDDGVEVVGIAGGPHHGHVVKLYSEKHNCGAYGESQHCSCGAYWQSAMYGCWQQGHQREEEGEKII